MKKIVKILGVLGMIMALAACGGKKEEEASVIKIGSILPLTGDIATFGESSKNGLLILQDEVNEAGGINGKKIEFLFEDDENKPASSASVAQKLINNDKVVAIIGSIASKCSIAVGPIATQSKIPMITPTSTNPKVTTQGGEYVFRACFIDPFQGKILAKFSAEDLKAKKAAVLYDVANDYSKGLAEFFQKGFEEAGGEVVSVETYNTGDSDFNAQLTKINALKPEVLLLPDYYNTVGLIAKQARSTGIDAIFLGGDGWDSPDLFTVGGDAVDGGYFTNHYSPEDTSPEVVAFKEAYEARFESVPSAFSALSYDAGKILVAAIEKAGSTDGEKIKEALKATDITAVSGKVKYDADRNPIKGAVILKTEAGKQKFFKKINID
ncbi:ABC transporter substrate-binding protein [Ilyobacter polytropus]|uniref:Amino acid/amide ABC transporter substrate-binding protein, HAAT family n=1 Tax=Ilyobacter polytropus (strain ATCC 51220 / DSM 2926 / LMG 16218 / CuHBu1) TaxID=572544 RepID=E3HB51_ILYPC|nr:ABC transporter substrate-binding protein [Ilyobacter polytropus]ADO82202.1 amino acid/amide ABC transporter substrate-binding protein, HAAT family [Ilyobacter polytropus DSM 2926]